MEIHKMWFATKYVEKNTSSKQFLQMCFFICYLLVTNIYMVKMITKIVSATRQNNIKYIK